MPDEQKYYLDTQSSPCPQKFPLIFNLAINLKRWFRLIFVTRVHQPWLICWLPEGWTWVYPRYRSLTLSWSWYSKFLRSRRSSHPKESKWSSLIYLALNLLSLTFSWNSNLSMFSMVCLCWKISTVITLLTSLLTHTLYSAFLHLLISSSQWYTKY